MSHRYRIERSPAYPEPWIVFPPAGHGPTRVIATFLHWADATAWAHHKALLDGKASHAFVDEFIAPDGTHYKLAT